MVQSLNAQYQYLIMIFFMNCIFNALINEYRIELKI